MKRDPELIRALMLALEAPEGAEILCLPDIDGYSPGQVQHHFRLLLEADLVAAGYTSADGRRWLALRLTWRGHDYLDAIYDPVIWRQTKKAMGKLGSWSLATMGTIAKALMLSQIETMGLVTSS